MKQPTYAQQCEAYIAELRAEKRALTATLARVQALPAKWRVGRMSDGFVVDCQDLDGLEACADDIEDALREPAMTTHEAEDTTPCV